jgi:hypothetical protein
MDTRRRKIMFLGSRAQLMLRAADSLTADYLDNVGSLTSHNPIGLHGLLWGQLNFFTFCSTLMAHPDLYNSCLFGKDLIT